MGLNGVAVLGLRLLPKMPIGYIDVRYGGWRQRVLVAGLDQHPLALSIWVIEKCRKCVCKWNEHVWLFKFEFDLYLNHQSLDNPTFVNCMPQFKSINSFSSAWGQKSGSITKNGSFIIRACPQVTLQVLFELVSNFIVTELLKYAG